MRMTRFSATLLLVCASLGGCGSSGLSGVRGQVTVDGAPAESGTISFKPAANPTSRGVGAALSAGQFELGGDQSLEPGRYLIAVQVMKATGKTFNHPQKGKVPVLQSVTLTDSPKEVEVTSDNAEQLQIAFTAKGT